MNKKICWRVVCVCVAVWVIAAMYQSAVEDPLTTELQRLQQIKTEYADLNSQAESLMQQTAAMKAEVEDKNSWPSIIGGGVRAFVDGATFGVFADEGIFSESKKFERWQNNFSQRDAARVARAQIILSKMQALENEYAQKQPAAIRGYQRYRYCGIAKSWSILIGIVFLVRAIYLQSKKESQPAAPSQAR